MKFSDNLIKLRKGKGWSQEDLADKLGLSRQAVSKWEVGTSKPDIDNVIKLSKLFEISIDELVNNEIVKTDAISIEVKKKDNKQKMLIWLRRLMIVLVVIYVVYVIYKFVMLFRITQAELNYKELNNYHYVITKYDSEGLREKEECWFKDGVSKTINIRYDEEKQKAITTCVDYKMQYGYIEENNTKKTIDMNNYLITNYDYLNGGQFYYKLPTEVRKSNFSYLMTKALIDNDMNINIQEDSIFFTWEGGFMNLEEGTMKPISLYYKEEKDNKFITTYFSIDLNCVDELKI